MRKHFKSRFPAANVSRLNEPVATDTFFSELEALDAGITDQLYAGVTSHLLAAYPMSHESKMPQSLMDFIREHAAPNCWFRRQQRPLERLLWYKKGLHRR